VRGYLTLSDLMALTDVLNDEEPCETHPDEPLVVCVACGRTVMCKACREKCYCERDE